MLPSKMYCWSHISWPTLYLLLEADRRPVGLPIAALLDVGYIYSEYF